MSSATVGNPPFSFFFAVACSFPVRMWCFCHVLWSNQPHEGPYKANAPCGGAVRRFLSDQIRIKPGFSLSLPPPRLSNNPLCHPSWIHSIGSGLSARFMRRVSYLDHVMTKGCRRQSKSCADMGCERLVAYRPSQTHGSARTNSSNRITSVASTLGGGLKPRGVFRCWITSGTS